MDFKITPKLLLLRQRYPLETKIRMSLNRITFWHRKYQGNVYVAFSGGKDSTVLLHLVRTLYPDVPAVFVNTGLEYPEIVEFVDNTENVVSLRPKMTFREVIRKHGYPVISKKVARAIRGLQNPNTSPRERNKLMYGDERGSFGKLPIKWRFLIDAPFKMSERCCDVLKLRPVRSYYKETQRKAFIGTMACDSDYRKQTYTKHGCYLVDRKIPTCTPMGFWLQQDIWDYIKKYKLNYSSIYGKGVSHTGCIFCCFGIHLEKQPNRFDLMKITHPKLHNYCMNKLGIRKILDYIGIRDCDSQLVHDVLKNHENGIINEIVGDL